MDGRPGRGVAAGDHRQGDHRDDLLRLTARRLRFDDVHLATGVHSGAEDLRQVVGLAVRGGATRSAVAVSVGAGISLVAAAEVTAEDVQATTTTTGRHDGRGVEILEVQERQR